MAILQNIKNLKGENKKMLKDLITNDEIEKLKENEKLAIIGELLTEDIKTIEDEKLLLEDLKKDDFKRIYKKYLINLTNDLYQKYISIKKLLID